MHGITSARANEAHYAPALWCAARNDNINRVGDVDLHDASLWQLVNAHHSLWTEGSVPLDQQICRMKQHQTTGMMNVSN